MSRRLPLLLTLCLGCAALPRGGEAVPVSAVRTSMLGRVEGLLKKSLEAEGWTYALVETKSDGTVARNSGECWDENVVSITFEAGKPPAPAAALTLREQVAAMGNLRGELRRLVTGQDGEVLEVSEGEGYRERTLSLNYKLGNAVGSVQVRLRPATDAPEETRNRLDVTLREQLAR